MQNQTSYLTSTRGYEVVDLSAEGEVALDGIQNIVFGIHAVFQCPST